MKSIWMLLFYFSCSTSFPQSFTNDASPVKDEIKQSIELYDHFTGAEAAIYNGGDYIPYIFKRTGNPFFESDSLTNGYIGYAGRVYHSIPMQYDITRNLVVILNYDRLSRIFLQNDLVDSFHFLNHSFIRIMKDPKQNLNNTDFYELIFNGRIQLLARRKKTFEDTFNQSDIIRVFYNHDVFYIHKDDTYYEVNNKKDVFRVFNNKIHEIKNLMRRQKIKFRRKNFGEALPTVAMIYDQLIR